MRTIRCLSSILISSLLLVGCHNWPEAPGGDTSKSQRGKPPGDHSADNLDVSVPGAAYPPRSQGLASQSKPYSDSWLLDAESDWNRFRRLEIVLRGADIHMLAIGFRFDRLHDAIQKENMDLAEYQMSKIVLAADIALLTRPGWHEGKGLEYMGRPEVLALRAAVTAHDLQSAKTAFLGVRRACMACHAEQKLAFLNSLEVFERTASFAEPSPPPAPPSSPGRPAPGGQP